jgi:prevent-host-death family protein
MFRLARMAVSEMARVAVSEARERLSEAVETARSEAVFIERNGRPAAVLVSPERYEEPIGGLAATSTVVPGPAYVGGHAPVDGDHLAGDVAGLL